MRGKRAHKLTLESIKQGTKIIYEGTGIHSQSKVFARADILILNSDKSWELLEVKVPLVQKTIMLMT